MSDKEGPTRCPFLRDQHERHGKNNYTSKWKCEIENIGMMDDSCTEQCITDYQDCTLFSKGIHHKDIPKVCPCASRDRENVCSLATRLGNGCGLRESYEYLECGRFSEWFYKQRCE